jgi:hypothetical protein
LRDKIPATSSPSRTNHGATGGHRLSHCPRHDDPRLAQTQGTHGVPSRYRTSYEHIAAPTQHSTASPRMNAQDSPQRKRSRATEIRLGRKGTILAARGQVAIFRDRKVVTRRSAKSKEQHIQIRRRFEDGLASARQKGFSLHHLGLVDCGVNQSGRWSTRDTSSEEALLPELVFKSRIDDGQPHRYQLSTSRGYRSRMVCVVT